MRLEFLPDGSEARPLVRLYDFTAQEARDLRKLLERLAEEKDQAVALHKLPWIQAIDCGLTLKVGKSNTGIRRAPKPTELECVLRPAGWEGAVGLVEPFGLDESANAGYQWLDESGDVRLLISRDGAW